MFLRHIYKPYRVYTTSRYDALGRRVWARTQRGTNCIAKNNPDAVCVSTVTRTVWDGPQVLFEIRAPGDTNAGAMMEDDANGTPKYGRVGYVHGLGIDQPLALFRDSQVVVPHATWRGVYDRGSCIPSPCPTGLQFPGGTGSGTVFGPSGVDPDKADWYGSLIWDQQDATGYQYKRNRYYDPGTGRFTQEDPIGLAGGLNLYGFASGDPVNFSDPFGLMRCPPACADVFQQVGRLLQPAETPLQVGTVLATAPLLASGEAAIVTLGLGARAAGGTATFFRGVSAAEAADVAAQGGKLRAGAAASGNEGKYLTNTIEAAGKWGAQHGEGSQVLKLTVAADAVKSFSPLGRIDAIGEAWWAPMSALKNANVEVVTRLLTPVPK